MSAHHSKQEDFLFTMVTWLPVGKKPSKTGTKVDSGREDVPCCEEFSDDKFAGEKERSGNWDYLLQTQAFLTRTLRISRLGNEKGRLPNEACPTSTANGHLLFWRRPQDHHEGSARLPNLTPLFCIIC